MLSGIGPADHLDSLGIEVVQHLPGAGENLHDHLHLFLVDVPLRHITSGQIAYGYSVLASVVAPASRGTLRLRSADPAAVPGTKARHSRDRPRRRHKRPADRRCVHHAGDRPGQHQRRGAGHSGARRRPGDGGPRPHSPVTIRWRRAYWRWLEPGRRVPERRSVPERHGHQQGRGPFVSQFPPARGWAVLAHHMAG